ncbi:MAG TPA: PP2C family protein-serine/threonine phosphatase [Acidobacteriaceae bacterium]
MPRRSANVLARLAPLRIPSLLSARLRSVAGQLLCLPLFLIAALSGASAQPATQTIVLGQSAVLLTGPWKFQPGDSPWVDDPRSRPAPGHFLWADPAFDDSAWSSMDLTPPANSIDLQFGNASFLPGWTTRGYPNLRGFAWYRLHLHVDSHGQPVAVEMPVNVDDAYQVFADGRYLGEFGQFHPHRVTLYYGHAVVLGLPPLGADGNLDLALRFYMSDVSPLRWPYAGGMHSTPLLGLGSTILYRGNVDNERVDDGALGDSLGALICLLALPFALWAAVRNRRDRVWRWLTLALAFNMAGVGAQTVGQLNWSASMWAGEFWGLTFSAPALELCWVVFWWRWFGLEKRSWIPRSGALLAAACFVTVFCFESPLLGFSFASQALLHACSIAMVCIYAALGALLLVLLVEGFRRDRTAALAATAPILLLEYSSLYAPLLVTIHSASHIFVGAFGIEYPALAAICMILIVGVLSVRRFLRNRDRELSEREAVARDLEQARQLQQSVLVAEGLRSPSFTVDVAYHPAQTVSGDFFLTSAQPDGTLLLLIGDVSGKGVSAAMLVAVLVGAARARARQTSDPAAILTELNAQLLGRSGGHFATCLVAALNPTGELHLANAGHIPPWRNGAEIEMPGSLPLGMTAPLDSAALTLQMQPGDTLTFVSDGVVEAQNAAGQLFGFDRARAISTESAEQIVAAAQTYGQSDDITVLTLQYAPAEVLHA